MFPDRDPTTSRGSLFQCSATLNVKFFLLLRWNLCFSFWPLLLVLSLGNTEESGTVFLTQTSEIPSILFLLD